MDSQDHPPSSPFHAGEISLQQRLGVAERMAAFGSKVVRDYLPEQHRSFYRQLHFLPIAAVDADGEVWASVLEGEPGFLDSPDPRHLRITAMPAAADPLAGGLAAGLAVGLLGIELPTRRRNRLNGTLSAAGPDGLLVEVGHAFGNCPQYIQTRGVRLQPGQRRNQDGGVHAGPGLDAAARALIAAADTFFVGSYVDPEGDPGRRQVDVSHRGGKPGFVHVDGDWLTVPDFAGNLHFNTLGNLLLNPRVGLMFIDFARGDVLQLVGRAELHFAHPLLPLFRGAERLWRVRVERHVWRRGALALRFDAGEISPNSLLTGSWDEAEAARAALQLARQWRPFRIRRVDDESTLIRSLYLEPDDGAGLPPWQPGQHVPLRLTDAASGEVLQRQYSLSSAPADAGYRISIKREGRASSRLHRLAVGDRVDLRAPAGGFVFDASERRPAVLLSAGVGITPMIAMLRQLVYEGQRSRRFRRAYFVHGARSAAERAFADEVETLRAAANGAVTVVQALSRPEPDLVAGKDFQHEGRIDIALLRALLTFDDYDFYLCGPAGFTQSLYDPLRALRIPDDRIHAEAFGPASLQRRPDGTAPVPALAPAAEVAVPVLFAESGKEARWTPTGASLLELAESRDLSPPYSCRQGSCGSCRTGLIEGAVTYRSPPSAPLAPGEALICCAVPAAGSQRLVLAL